MNYKAFQDPYVEVNKNRDLKVPIFIVGVIRLELTTPCTPCKYASQLRHTPIKRSKFTKDFIWSTNGT